jgi:threonine synthase
MTAGSWREVCGACGRTWALSDLRWLCGCGGLLDLVGPLADPVPSGRPDQQPPGSPLARYAAALPPGTGRVDLDMAVTPLHEAAPGMFVKCDFQQPTGSFKDRGAAVMIGAAAALGIESVVVDSSGNAGRAAAAHAAAASMACTVYVPAGTDRRKSGAIAAYGARLIEVPGGRAAAAAAAQASLRAPKVEPPPWYASHVYQPLFHHGVKTLAYELYEQLSDLDRATVVVPAGNGTLVLGLWLGFGELAALGRLRRRPAVVAVQAERCAPLAGLSVDPDGPPTVAAGIAVAAPPRAAQVRAAVMASGGRLVTVSEADIEAALTDLGRLGFEVEPTGAVGWAAVPHMPGVDGPVIVVLTGR